MAVQQDVQWDDECDVLVVGSGGGGVTGAYTAAREGLETIMAEATDRFGGVTSYSGGGGMWFPTNAVLKRGGDEDTIEDALTYYRSVVGDRTPADLQEAFVRAGAPLIDYLEQDKNFKFMELPWPDYFGKAPKASAKGRHIIPVPLDPARLGELRDSLRPPLDTDWLGWELPPQVIGGQALIGRFLLAIEQYPNARTRLNCAIDELVMEDGKVVGAIADTGGERTAIKVRRGVIVASGGFERNDEMRTKYGVPGVSRDSMAPPGSQGKAIAAGIAAGADTDLMDQAWWSPGLTHPDGNSSFALWFTGGIFVNQDGERFVNESAAYDRLGRAALDQIADGTLTLPFWMVYDDREGLEPPIKATNVSMQESEKYVDAGLWKTADTLEELAEQIGVPADRLVATVERFNGFVKNGHDDDFLRGDEPYDRAFSDGELPLTPITQGPFHAARFGLSDLGTKGGMRTDTVGRVLDAEGGVIRGLYAAGNSMAAPSGYVYPGGGNPIGTSMVFAHLAAKDLAEG
ncbi:FAD-binding protein [Tomitella fengzijianii]|uniref:FAD-binding protein n=1 Tax=Tomitella fengzijianii TaxID=2597660 RepID=UPI001E3E904C|nr:FAD-binding protein [Tomitella fengzijianii]